MKPLGIILAAAAAAILCACAPFHYSSQPIRPGEIWPDDQGNHINAHGGGILVHGNTFYWFGEHKGEHGSDARVGVNCYSSKDLVNWKYEGVALAVEEDPDSEITSGCVIERPKVIYNGKTKKFVMWFHLELKGKGYSAARAAVAVSDNVTGPYRYLGSGRVNPGIMAENLTDDDMAFVDSIKEPLKEWTPEWLEAVEHGLIFKRDFEGGQMARDMTLYVDDDGKAYHIYSSEENLTLNIAELSDDYLSHSGRFVRIAPTGHNEAPAIFKKDGTYWMITSGCTGWAPNAARLYSAPSIMGPWTRHPNPCRGEKSEITYGGQSTYILPVPGKKDLYIFMADIWKPRRQIDARYIWLPIQFEEDGTPFLEWMDEWSIGQ